MIKGWNMCECVFHPSRTYVNVMFRSYLWLNVGYHFTYATNENFSYANHLQLVFNLKLKWQNDIF